MTKSEKKYFLFSKVFFKNVALLFIIIIAGFFILTGILNAFTHHGQNIAVPDLRGIKVSKLDSILVTHNFHYKVVDSLYEPDKLPGAVLDQDPAAGSKVKENRTIYLTINSSIPPDVKMPDLVDVSFRQAEAILQTFGLATGEIVYRSDLAKNAVLEQRYNNKIIPPGTLIPKGAMIDLVLGDGLGDADFPVPDLTGLTKQQAWSVLKRSTLSIGEVHFDAGVDSISAKIYNQKPLPHTGINLKQGDSVDIYLH